MEFVTLSVGEKPTEIMGLMFDCRDGFVGGRSGRIDVGSEYGLMDADTVMLLHRWDEPKDALILEVAANQSATANVLTDNGWRVLGVDLQEVQDAPKPNYHRLRGEFVELASREIFPKFDCIYSTSAIEHFGLGCYPGCPKDRDLDKKALRLMESLLNPGGVCYLTVPYGRNFAEKGDWRVYDRNALRERLIGGFKVEEKIFFKSGGCECPDSEGIIKEMDADEYAGGEKHPHVTVFLKMRKP